MENGQQISDFANLHDQIYHADCMELMAHIPNGFVSLILTDPPYGISYQNHFTRKKHQILEGDTGIDYERFAYIRNIVKVVYKGFFWRDYWKFITQNKIFI